jgi:hypothetical protein
MSQDLKGDHLQLVKDTDQDMKDFIVEFFSKTLTEVGKGPFARYKRRVKAGMGAVSPAFVLVTEVFTKLGDTGISIQMAEEVNQKKAWRIVAGRSELRVAIGYQGTDKAEVNEGSDHSGHAALDGAGGADFHEPFLEPIPG